MKRREFLKTVVYTGAAAFLPLHRADASTHTLRIALLHLAPVPGDLAGNRTLVEKAMTTAAESGAEWMITPELCTCGYDFAEMIGTDWIRPQPDEWMKGICTLAAHLGATVFLAHPEMDPLSKKLYNSVFVIGPDGRILGRHRKIRIIPGGAESWTSPGDQAFPIKVQPFGKVGVLICADAYAPWISQRLKEQGAKLLVSSAAWGPGPYGPNGEWERASSDTGLPLLVCNRTGMDRTLDFTRAESVVVKEGRRLYSMASESSAIFLVDWDLRKQAPVPGAPRTISLEVDRGTG